MWGERLREADAGRFLGMIMTRDMEVNIHEIPLSDSVYHISVFVSSPALACRDTNTWTIKFTHQSPHFQYSFFVAVACATFAQILALVRV